MDWKWLLRTAGISLAAGVAAGFAADRIISWKTAGDAWDALEEYSGEEGEWPDIPDGVNEESGWVEITEDPYGRSPRVQESMYSKPDLSKLVDYTGFSKKDGDGGEHKAADLPGVEIISEEEFVRGTGNLDGYVSVTGTWFAGECVLAGWDSDLDIKDPAATVGEKAVEMFEDPEIKAVYVRNDVLKVLFEIVRSEEAYDLAVEEAYDAAVEGAQPPAGRHAAQTERG